MSVINLTQKERKDRKAMRGKVTRVLDEMRAGTPLRQIEEKLDEEENCAARTHLIVR